MSTHMLLYRQNGDIFDLPVAPGPAFGDTVAMGKWDSDWSHIESIGSDGQPAFLLYKRDTGQVFTMPILGGTEYGAVTSRGIWETDWAHLTPFRSGAHQFLLLCRDNGDVFYLEVGSDLSMSKTTRIGHWGSGIAHLRFLDIEGHQFFLLVREDGSAWLRRMRYTEKPTAQRLGEVPTRLHIDDVARIGQWEPNWKHVLPVATAGATWLLFQRPTGEVFTMPVSWPAENLEPDDLKYPRFHDTTPAGTWESDWAGIAAFGISDMAFGIDQLGIVNQKSDTAHADVDSLSLVWSITRAATRDFRIYSRTIAIPGALSSGQTVAGPFSTDPFKLSAGDLMTVTAVISNLGATPADLQTAQALAITKKTVDDLGPLVGSIVGTAIGGPQGGVIEGFKKGKDITDAFDWAVQSLSDLASSLGIPVGHPDCNGVVLQNTWTYAYGDLQSAVGLPVTVQLTGPEKAGCGHEPVTSVVTSVRMA